MHRGDTVSHEVLSVGTEGLLAGAGKRRCREGEEESWERVWSHGGRLSRFPEVGSFPYGLCPEAAGEAR